jgi:hypothetical protein
VCRCQCIVGRVGRCERGRQLLCACLENGARGWIVGEGTGHIRGGVQLRCAEGGPLRNGGWRSPGDHRTGLGDGKLHRGHCGGRVGVVRRNEYRRECLGSSLQHRPGSRCVGKASRRVRRSIQLGIAQGCTVWDRRRSIPCNGWSVGAGARRGHCDLCRRAQVLRGRTCRRCGWTSRSGLNIGPLHGQRAGRFAD